MEFKMTPKWGICDYKFSENLSLSYSILCRCHINHVHVNEKSYKFSKWKKVRIKGPYSPFQCISTSSQPRLQIVWVIIMTQEALLELFEQVISQLSFQSPIQNKWILEIDMVVSQSHQFLNFVFLSEFGRLFSKSESPTATV